MSLLSEILPVTIFETHSSFSGSIKVVDFRGEKRLMIGNLIQSISPKNPISHKVWGRLASPPPVGKKAAVLILGLGGGTVANLIARDLNPRVIVGVEIDPAVIDIGRKFFDLDKIRGIRIVNLDAREFVKESDERFDYIVVDTYKGGLFPRFLESPAFILSLKNILNKDGTLVFNRIFRTSKPEKRLEFIRILEAVFGPVEEEIVEGPSDAKNYLYWMHLSTIGMSKPAPNSSI